MKFQPRPVNFRRDLPDEPVHYHQSTFFSLGSTLFSPKIIVGVLFVIGVLVANWRHAVVAALSALMAAALAEHVHVVGGAVNTGFIGFNAVLAGLAHRTIGRHPGWAGSQAIDIRPTDEACWCPWSTRQCTPPDGQY